MRVSKLSLGFLVVVLVGFLGCGGPEPPVDAAGFHTKIQDARLFNDWERVRQSAREAQHAFPHVVGFVADEADALCRLGQLEEAARRYRDAADRGLARDNLAKFCGEQLVGLAPFDEAVQIAGERKQRIHERAFQAAFLERVEPRPVSSRQQLVERAASEFAALEARLDEQDVNLVVLAWWGAADQNLSDVLAWIESGAPPGELGEEDARVLLTALRRYDEGPRRQRMRTATPALAALRTEALERLDAALARHGAPRPPLAHFIGATALPHTELGKERFLEACSAARPGLGESPEGRACARALGGEDDDALSGVTAYERHAFATQIAGRELIGMNLANAVVVDCGGSKHRLATYEQGSPLVLEFWTVWCKPCDENAALLAAWKAREKKPSFGLIEINLDGEAAGWDDERVCALGKERGRSSPQVALPGGLEDPWIKQLGLNSVPTTLVLDKNRRIVHVHRSAFTEDELEKLLRDAS